MKQENYTHFQHWPKTGAILSIGDKANTLEETEGYDFACELLCENSARSRALLKANSHPDLYKLKPLEENHAIKIAEVRELIEWSQTKPQISSRKIALIYPAEALNLQAANALLKTLEEVALDTLFILITAKEQAKLSLPKTIISRCEIIRFNFGAQLISNESQSKEKNIPIEKQLEEQLEEQVARDLQLLESKKMEPVTLAALWLKQDLNHVLYALLVILNKKICLMAKTGNIAHTRDHFDFLDSVYETRRSLQEHSQLNKQLMLESLLIQYGISR